MIQQISQQSTAMLQEFIEVVLEDRVLQEQLKEAANKDSFLNLVIELGQQKGYSFTAEELEVMMGESHEYLGKPQADRMAIHQFNAPIKDIY